MDDFIQCSKCQSIPTDVLIMNCNHNLCLSCAVQKFNIQQTKKTVTGKTFLQCQKCKTKTNLDQQSSNQLQKVMKNKNNNPKQIIKQSENRIQTPFNKNRNTNNGATKQQKLKCVGEQLKQKQKGWVEKQRSPGQNQKLKNNMSIAQKTSANQAYGLCQGHKQEPVMYYCFDCKIHCFCAECILNGKHNKHNVKTIKKAFSVIEQQFNDSVERTQKFIEQLLRKSKMIADDINSSKNAADDMKRNIQKKFDEVRKIIRQKQLEFIKIVDKQFIRMLEATNGQLKLQINQKLKQQNQLLLQLRINKQKGEESILNFYSDKWKKVTEVIKKQKIVSENAQYKVEQVLSEYITILKHEIQKVKIKQIYV